MTKTASQEVLMRASKARRGIAESPIPAVPRLALPCFKLLHRGSTMLTKKSAASNASNYLTEKSASNALNYFSGTQRSQDKEGC